MSLLYQQWMAKQLLIHKYSSLDSLTSVWWRVAPLQKQFPPYLYAKCTSLQLFMGVISFLAMHCRRLSPSQTHRPSILTSLKATQPPGNPSPIFHSAHQGPKVSFYTCLTQSKFLLGWQKCWMVKDPSGREARRKLNRRKGCQRPKRLRKSIIKLG